MTCFCYNDMEFALEPISDAWEIVRQRADGTWAVTATGLFPGVTASEAGDRARALVQTIYPVGVRIVPPDVTHPTRIGELKLVPPDVTHPNFIHWDRDSSSAP